VFQDLNSGPCPNDSIAKDGSLYALSGSRLDKSIIVSITDNYQFDQTSWFVGDVILTAADSPVSNMADLCDVLRSQRPGETIEVYGYGKFYENGEFIGWNYWSSDIIVP
jgi:S1-C subfamily serine protease